MSAARRAWSRLGLRGRLAISIGAIVVAAFAVVFVFARAQLSHESGVIRQEESREQRRPAANGAERVEASSGVSPIEDAQSDLERTLLIVGVATLLATLLAGYLLAARAAAPLRRFATTAAAVDAGDLTPRLDPGRGAPAELRTLAEAFNHMLDRLDRAFAEQRRFASDASHELRSPLTAIRGQLEVLARSEAPDAAEVRRVEALALAEMGRVERLVEDLLALARLDEGAGTTRRAIDAAGFLRELAATAPGGAELGELAAGQLEADPDLIARVVRNLLENARRAASAGGQVALSSTGSGERLTIRVEDDGPGIPEAERERVFDRFYRSDLARDRASGGSGLGLAIARAIVAAHGGRIWVEDSALGGARVSVELPGFAAKMRDFSR
jgi:two-component system OmpR family sensor kinase